ncbi:MAG TPA: ATP-binding protein [Candidatus Eisenbacteria bacterium]|nr:ATP-binding protein [Candidatus Eisenbacteria bacterium]
MPLGRGPRTLKAELQFRFLAVGSVFLVVATALLYINGQGSLRRQILTNAVTASETAASLVAVEDHRLIRTAADMNSQAFRTIVTNLGALRRANPSIYHLFTLAPGTRLGTWGVVVDLGSTGNESGVSDASLVRGRLPIGSPPPKDVPEALLRQGMAQTTSVVLDLTRPDLARVVAVSPIRATGGEAVGLVVVQMSAGALASEARLLAYVCVGIFLLGLVASALASTYVSRWLTRPIEDLLGAVEAISKGDLATRVRVDGHKHELDALGTAFNHMAETLESSRGRNDAQQGRLRELNRIGTSAAATLDLPVMLEMVAEGMRAICGGEEAFAGVAAPRDEAVHHWVGSGPGAHDLATTPVPLEGLTRVLGGEARLLSRAEMDAAGLSWLRQRPGEYALAAPLKASDDTIGALIAVGDRGQFHDDAVSLASVFATQISAAVGNARLFEQVKALDRSKSEFLSIASHEVRTPLTVIKSSLDVLVSNKAFTYTTDQRQLIAFCQQSVERLIQLVKDILDVSKIEAGVLQIQFIPTSLNELVTKCLFWVPQLPGGQGIEVEARLPSEPAMVSADPGRIMQVLENLISNALKFSKPGGKVTIELVEHGAEYEIVVSDQGKGIAAEHLERIFGKFYQVEESTTREQGGTGLGLAICKGIIRAHRGRIWAESELGKGSRFHFTLTKDGADAARPDAQMSVADLLSSLRSETPSPTRS